MRGTTVSSTDTFYSSIVPRERFQDLTDSRNYVALPGDWSIAFADVVNSTAAIARGEYKAVNTVGVSVIAAITNALRPIEVPYVFGGDGAVVCVPSNGSEEVRAALAATAAMAMAQFGLQLRLALVPISYVRSTGDEVLVGRYRVSPHVNQCAFLGSGLAKIEREAKAGSLRREYLIDADLMAQADYSGLECRWKEIPSPSEETVAVIIEATGSVDEALIEYGKTLEEIRKIYGDDEQCRPVRIEGLSATLKTRVLRNESRVRTWGMKALDRFRYGVIQRLYVIVGWVFFLTGRKSSTTDWSQYKPDVVAHTDFRKLDGLLRLVLTGRADQRKTLETYLRQRTHERAIRFGLHVSQSAIMTCLVSNRQHEHVHFVDASGGGYAEAAKMMKS